MNPYVRFILLVQWLGFLNFSHRCVAQLKISLLNNCSVYKVGESTLCHLAPKQTQITNEVNSITNPIVRHVSAFLQHFSGFCDASVLLLCQDLFALHNMWSWSWVNEMIRCTSRWNENISWGMSLWSDCVTVKWH